MCSASSLQGQTPGHLITRPEITSYVEVGIWIFKLKKKKKLPRTKGSSPEERIGNPSLPACPRFAGGLPLLPTPGHLLPDRWRILRDFCASPASGVERRNPLDPCRMDYAGGCLTTIRSSACCNSPEGLAFQLCSPAKRFH